MGAPHCPTACSAGVATRTRSPQWCDSCARPRRAMSLARRSTSTAVRSCRDVRGLGPGIQQADAGSVEILGIAGDDAEAEFQGRSGEQSIGLLIGVPGPLPLPYQPAPADQDTFVDLQKTVGEPGEHAVPQPGF